GPAPLPPEGEGWATGEVATAGLGSGPWAFEVGAGADLLARLRAGGPPLGEVARISKGAGTNADPIFVIPAGAEGELEREALIPCLRGRDIGRYTARSWHRALLPYDGDRLLHPEELRARWPRAAAYLEAWREPLERRERRRFA